jgi:3-dehydroquinate synthetase
VDDGVVALGGGSLLDVAGYAASQVRGGIGIVRIPTTVAAMIEGGFASYAAVDSVNVKDALRVPSTPISVLVDTSFASTILDGVWRGGIGEAVRLALSYDASFFKKMRDVEYQRNENRKDQVARKVASKDGDGHKDLHCVCEIAREDTLECRYKDGDSFN